MGHAMGWAIGLGHGPGPWFFCLLFFFVFLCIMFFIGFYYKQIYFIKTGVFYQITKNPSARQSQLPLWRYHAIVDSIPVPTATQTRVIKLGPQDGY